MVKLSCWLVVFIGLIKTVDTNTMVISITSSKKTEVWSNLGKKPMSKYRRHAYSLLNLGDNDVILDIGCADGYFGNCISSGKRWVVGIDMRKNALLEAKTKELDVVLASATFLPFKECSFDKISMLEVFEHLKIGENSQVMKEIYQSLRKTGTFVMSVPNRGLFFQYIFLDPAYWIQTHRHFTTSEIYEILTSAGFSVKNLYVSGGLIFILIYYSIYWRIKRYGLLKMGLISKLLSFLDLVADLEFNQQKLGCSVIAKARKP